MTDGGVLQIVLGGARSGKTLHGVTLAETLWQQGRHTRLIYLATAQAWDAEMRTKIANHQKERQNQPWQTDEEPLEIAARLAQYTQQDIVLLDSIGMWASNLLLAEYHDTEQAAESLLATTKNCLAHCIFVADEVGQGVVPASKMGRQFREVNGKINQQLCAQATGVDFVVAGLVQTIKITEEIG